MERAERMARCSALLAVGTGLAAPLLLLQPAQPSLVGVGIMAFATGAVAGAAGHSYALVADACAAAAAGSGK